MSKRVIATLAYFLISLSSQERHSNNNIKNTSITEVVYLYLPSHITPKRGYIPINKNSYGFRNYASKLEFSFLREVSIIAAERGFDANELLALIHCESFYHPSAFNINWYVAQSSRDYYPSGDGGVGLLQFSKEWVSPFSRYQFSNFNRVQQLQLFHKRLIQIINQSVYYQSIINHPGGLSQIIMGSHRGSVMDLCNYLRNPYLGHAGAMYFTDKPTSYNSGQIVLFSKRKNNFVLHCENLFKIEKEFYKNKQQ